MKAAQQGVAEAANDLGVFLAYSSGSKHRMMEGGSIALANAVKWLQVASRADFSVAKFNLAIMHEKGCGYAVIPDAAKAARLYTAAAEQGLAQAQYILANLYSVGSIPNTKY